MSSHQHKKHAPVNLNVAILTVSTSRSLAEDKSGKWIAAHAVQKERHTVVCHDLVTDDIKAIQEGVCDAINTHSPHLLILTGGTGIAKKDLTIEAVRPLFRKELTAFAPLATQVSAEKIDSAAMLSRTTAGIIGKTAVFCIPGSLDACKRICKALIFPEAGHLAKHIDE
ncbi:MAG: MogA/MoaB family molybdenum cofactor biosynthesis protein [Thermodesulfobacteriota bacterium]|nr:MogA/MoaB family molybdenum cofactor biosynthesis protein [Thermodesulfobacteriota bacterium]